MVEHQNRARDGFDLVQFRVWKTTGLENHALVIGGGECVEQLSRRSIDRKPALGGGGFNPLQAIVNLDAFGEGNAVDFALSSQSLRDRVATVDELVAWRQRRQDF
jgi:hypothetical protein